MKGQQERTEDTAAQQPDGTREPAPGAGPDRPAVPTPAAEPDPAVAPAPDAVSHAETGPNPAAVGNTQDGAKPPAGEKPEVASKSAALPNTQAGPEPAAGPGPEAASEAAAVAEPVNPPEPAPADGARPVGGRQWRPDAGESAGRPDPVAELDRLGRRMERAIGGFVDDPRRAVREADAVLEEATDRLARLLAERRRSLRDSWHADDGAPAADTEELRIALTRYRDMTRQLLTVG